MPRPSDGVRQPCHVMASATRARDAEQRVYRSLHGAERDDLEGLTEVERVRAMTEAELEAAIDHDEAGEFDWSTVQVGIPGPKQQPTIRLDRDVIAWFKAQGAGNQTRLNAVLRSYVAAHKK